MSAPPRHRLPDGAPKYTNRLFWEDSLYLRQHAHNPVDWYPWGKEAFAIAEKLSRPVLLSIGYATCHWCHVMAEESFEDEAIASLLNSRYVAIKVDRELRPDVDYAYITFVQALAGHAGWPLTVWLTPDRNPFAGGTYFPPYDRDGRIGFATLLAAQADRFVMEGARTVVAEAKQYATRLREITTRAAPKDLPRGTPEALLVETADRFDRKAGGFVGAPKFPSTFPLGPCFRLRARSAAHEAMAIETLWAMRNGGIFDQLGHGFHRYSVDAAWRVPHFEKMLYDNALLARSYLLGGACAPSLDAVVREVLDFLLAEFRAPNGTFYAATDADSRDAQGRLEEGLYFTWTPEELKSALGEEQGGLAAYSYGVGPGGRSALSRPRGYDSMAAELGRERAGLEAELAEVRLKLLAARQQREPPSRDEKQLTSWNALTVSALAQAAVALGDGRYADAALAAAAPFRAALAKGNLPHVLGPRSEAAFGDDFAYLAEALLDLFELTADGACLQESRAAMEALERDFLDPTSGAYSCSSRAHHEELFLPFDATQDGPTPNVNCVAAMNWARLAGYFGDQSLAKRALRITRAFGATLARHPLALPGLVEVIDWLSALPPEVVVVIPEGKGALAPSARPFLDVLRKLPTRLLVVASEAELSGELGSMVRWASDKRLVGGGPTVYLCEGESCREPMTLVENLDKLLREFTPSPRRASSIIDPAKTPVL